MARVTVEDCVLQVPNRFELVMLAAHRGRGIAAGAELKLERDRDKNPVVALREIAEQKLDLGSLEESLIKSLQKRIEPDQPEEDYSELMASEQKSWIGADDAGEDADDMGDEDEDAGNGDMAIDEGGSFEDAEVQD